jgi:dTDP-glucose pyrophosphorylase
MRSSGREEHLKMAGEILGVILAAGKGSRLHPFSERYPKPILPVCNRPLLHYQLDSMKSLGINKTYIVIGHYGFEVVKYIGDGKPFGMSIEYIEQDQPLGTAHAVSVLENVLDRPFLLLLGDIYFIPENLHLLAEPLLSGKVNAVLAARQESDPEAIKRNFSIFLGKDGLVEKVVEKPRNIETSLKGTGIYLFDLHVMDAIRHTPRTALRNEYEITDTIQVLINSGRKVQAMELIKHDLNLTYPLDLLKANQMELERRGQNRLIGENFQGPEESRIKRSVIGDNVRIKGDVSISDSVIFSGSVIQAEQDLEQVIIAPDMQIRCSVEQERDK